MAWSLLTCVVHATEVWRRELDGGPLLDDPRAHGQRRINCIRSSRAVSLSLTTALLPGVMGCSEKSGVEEQTKVSGPEGTTTITKATKVKSSGKNPPAVDPDSSKPVTPPTRTP